jgi:photosystem II stability/assembly factor-like uncharacterized protein
MHGPALVLGAALLGALGPSGTGVAAPAWRLVATIELPGELGSAVFRDEAHGIAAHCNPMAAYASVTATDDEGRTWRPPPGERCGFGLELRGERVWRTGNLGKVRGSTDGGRTWSPLGSFGGAVPNHATWLSFGDERRGAIASHMDLGVTVDGGQTWRRVALPAGAGTLAVVSMAPGGVLRVLAPEGKLWASRDLGRTWRRRPTPVRSPFFEFTNGPHAVLRFVSPREGVLAAMLEEGGLPVGRVYRTLDGGRTWAEEQVEGGVRSSPLALSADGELLTSLEHVVVRLYRRARPGGAGR